MTDNFLSAMTSENVLGENLMPTNSTSGNALVDMFFAMGASRAVSPDELAQYFINSFAADPENTVKAVFYNRDIRGGQGERRSFRIFFRYLCEHHPDIALKNIPNVPFYGRWDDLLVGLHSPVEESIAAYIFKALKGGDQLCAKWMPRENKSLRFLAKHLIKLMGVHPKTYRHLLSGNTNVVENLMCAAKWGAIDYNKVPSIAINKYRNAFYRHDEARFTEWVESLTDPDKKQDVRIHADAIFPHDIVNKYLNRFGVESTEDKMLQAQWDALPNYMPEEDYNILPVCDTSGSMLDGLSINVCVALGLYLSERNPGKFNNMFMTFSGKPELQHLTSKSLREKILQLSTAKWGMNTNLELMFNVILTQALKFNVPEKEMPHVLLILSDMQFDQCVRNADLTAIKMMRQLYEESGYKLPQVVFWNLRNSIGVPVKFNESGVALVSGFSPSIMKNILGGEMNPLNIVMNTLNSERYERVKL